MKPISGILRAVQRGIRTLSPDCREAVRRKSAALDGHLTLPQRIGLNLHLLICKWCRRYSEQLDLLRQVSSRAPDQEASLPTVRLTPEARERIRQKLKTPHQ